MISIIIASANESLLKEVSENIKSTIGVPFEIISFENSSGKYGICSIYNKGAKKAKYDVLCYMHEDVEIKTKNWGVKILNNFDRDENIGIIGIVGSAYKPFAPSGWGAASTTNGVIFSNYIQYYKHSNKPHHLMSFNQTGKLINEVACIDGVWFCTKRSTALEYKFDENLLKGFHCYDLDFCLNVGRSFKICVTHEVLIEHFSEGSYNRGWLEDTLKIHDKWESILPINLNNIDRKECLDMEKRALKVFFKKLKYFGYGYNYSKSILNAQYNKQSINFQLYMKLHYYLIKTYVLT